MALQVTYLTSEVMAPMRGYCCLVLQRHAVELYELSEQESSALMRDMKRAALAIQQITGAVKMNYQIHGNTIPYLHVHVFPRYRNDPFQGGPIDPRKMPTSPYTTGEYESFLDQLRFKLTHT